MMTPTAAPPKLTITCAGCERQVELKGKRLPRGWKHVGEDYWCEDCWTARYMLRAISIPVASPVPAKAAKSAKAKDKQLRAEWKELRKAVSAMWALTTQASNWMMTELYARDVRRQGEDKMPARPPTYLYPEASERFPELPTQTVAALEQSVTRKYRALRRKVVWTCAASLPTHRYPVPFPLPNQAWSVSIDEDGRAVVSVLIGRPPRWSLRLRGGARYRRQLAAVKHIASATAKRSELQLYQRGKHLMCKMVAWLPRPEAGKPRSGVLHVRTHAESLLVALNDKDEKLWVYHADHLPRWQAEHARRLQRWSDDTKAEQRPVPSFAERRSAAAAKYRNRMRSAVQEAAAYVVNYAARRRFAVLRYDDTVHEFCASFPWFALRERLKAKCDELGIQLELASTEAAPESAEPLAGAEDDEN